MKHVRQPVGSNQCGQAVLAMICGMSLGNVVKALGKRGRTKTSDLVQFLRQQGFDCDGRLRRVSGKWDRTNLENCYAVIFRIRWTGSRSHWVVYHKGQTFDPVNSKPLQGLVQFYGCGGLITSYLNVWRQR